MVFSAGMDDLKKRGNFLPLLGFYPLIVDHVVGLFVDYAITATRYRVFFGANAAYSFWISCSPPVSRAVTTDYIAQHVQRINSPVIHKDWGWHVVLIGTVST